MAFLVCAGLGNSQIDPCLLTGAAGRNPIAWFDAEDPGLGGAVCLSPLASLSRLKHGDRRDLFIVGRMRLDRRQELHAKLAEELRTHSSAPSDPDLCLLAYLKWGADFVDHLHGDFAFVVHDGYARELICVRDRLGVRLLAWSQSGNTSWIAGSLQDLVAARGVNGVQLDPYWISDFLRTGGCADPARSVYAGIQRLPPAYMLSMGSQGVSARRYWRLEVDGPRHRKSSAAFVEEFHWRLDAAMRDRLPPDRVGVMMSGGLDSSTLAAKAVELGAPQLQVHVSTWLTGGQSDPEAQASRQVADYLGLEQTVVDAGQHQYDPRLLHNPIATVEPDLAAMAPSALNAEAISRSRQATCWLYGEGPDNALTFEWQMYIRWLARHGQWRHLAEAISAYLITKSPADWKTTLASRVGRHRADLAIQDAELDWVKGAGSPAHDDPANDWRPSAHRNLSSALWPGLFERLDAKDAQFGIDWRHPYMDLRVLEFLLETPPIPWARHKLLIRKAMKDRLPPATLRRRKMPLYRDDLVDLLRTYLPGLPRRGSAVEMYVDIDRLPECPSTYPDVYALARLVILDRWLMTRHG